MAIHLDSQSTTSTPILPVATPESLGLDARRLNDLYRLIESHIDAGHYPGAQVAIARFGKLAASRSFGHARIAPTNQLANDETLWLLYSQTKVVTVAALWQLVDRGALSFADRVADHVPEFAYGGKHEITIFQLLTHQGGFPSATVPVGAWTDHDLLRRYVSRFALEWTPGSRVQYHAAAAHWTAAVIIEAVTGRDYRDVIRTDLLDPIGIDDIFVGLPRDQHRRAADMHLRQGNEQISLADNNSAAFRDAGVPGGGGYATAPAMAAFYQMLAAGGSLNGTRVLSRRVIEYATRNHTDERIDEQMRMPMHRGVGPHIRGLSPTIRGLGTIASPRSFGHGGAGSSYSWADPDSGVSFTYLSNCRSDEPFHSQRLDRLSNIVHASIAEV